jgi:hypothetical protein
MAYEDLVAKFEAFTAPDSGVTPDIDVVLNGVTEVYNSDISIRDHAVQTYKEKLAQQELENSKLKQANYDLLMKQPAGNVTPDNGKNTDPDELDESERAATITVADLFTKRK